LGSHLFILETLVLSTTYFQNAIWIYFDVDQMHVQPSSAFRAEIVDIIRKTEYFTIDGDGSNKGLRLE
jgi:hypothetical protein